MVLIYVFYVIQVTPACNVLCMYLTHVSITSISSYIVNTLFHSTCFILYCTNTYLCRAIARALMFIVVFYIGYTTRNKIVCYFMLCYAIQHVLYYIVQILIYIVQ